MNPQTRLLPLVALLLLASVPATTHAGKAVLKNGTILEGEVVGIRGLTPSLLKRENRPDAKPMIFMVHAGHKRYFVPRTKMDMAKSTFGAVLNRGEVFEFKRFLRGRAPGWRVLGQYRIRANWTKFGRRTVQVFTPANPKNGEPVIQAVTKISPQYVEVVGLKHKWQFGIPVKSMEPKILNAMIYQLIDAKKSSDRLAVVRFYIQAGMYTWADNELTKLERDFPELKTKAKAVRYELRQLTAKEIISELKRRRVAGQHELVIRSCTIFPREKVTASALREIGLIKRDYENQRKQIDRVNMLLVALESQLKDKALITAVKPMRSAVKDSLDYNSLVRLDAFLKLADDRTLKESDRLALAYSGWMLGAANAHTDLKLATQQWQARFLVLEYLRTDNPLKRKRLLTTIQKIESLKPEHIGWMLPHLPPVIETPYVKPGRVSHVKVAGREGKPTLTYSVLLPPEYSPHRKYPTIVALRPGERTTSAAAVWWGGTEERPGPAQRHGYIVIAPEYAGGRGGAYDYSSQAHAAVIQCLRDARKRFRIDSDRTFLSGIGTGGDAAFDMGMSHPDLFAGVIPITGISDKYCMWYLNNAKDVPWYIVNGELARDSLSRNARELSKMMVKSPVFDVIYVEYIGRGYESYYEEIHNLFDWMTLHRRRKYPKKIDAKVLRVSDDRFWWLKQEGFPRSVTHSTVMVKGVRKTTPMPFTARVTPGNYIEIKTGQAPGGSIWTLWLSPEFVSYNRPAVVRYGNKRLHRGFLTRQLDTLLEDFRVRADREKLYWTKLRVSKAGLID